MIAVLAALAADPGAEAFARALALEFHQDGMYMDAAAEDAAYAAACAGGEPLACARTWPRGDLVAAGKALDGACEAGNAAACLVVGWRFAQRTAGEFDVRAADAAKAPSRFERACAAGLERGCVEQGALHQLGVGVEKDPVKARSLLQTACQAGDPAGCRRLGALFHAGEGVDRDLARARELYAEACDAGLLAGCNGLALLDHLGLDGAADPEAAAARYVAACDGGYRSACQNLEKLYAQGARPDQDLERALRIWRVGCDRGVPAACANAADAVPGPEARALRERGCGLGDPYSCGALGQDLLADGEASWERAGGLLEAACEAGIVESCRALIAEVGRKGAHPDRELEVRLHASACLSKDPPSCLALADALWKGDGAEKDREQAAGFYARACGAGLQAACKRAAPVSPPAE